MKKIETLWGRFLLLAKEEARLNKAGIGEKETNRGYLVNVFTSSGVRRVRALQLLSDIRKELAKAGIQEEKFFARLKALQG